MQRGDAIGIAGDSRERPSLAGQQEESITRRGHLSLTTAPNSCINPLSPLSERGAEADVGPGQQHAQSCQDDDRPTSTQAGWLYRMRLHEKHHRCREQH